MTGRRIIVQNFVGSQNIIVDYLRAGTTLKYELLCLPADLCRKTSLFEHFGAVKDFWAGRELPETPAGRPTKVLTDPILCLNIPQ